MLVFEIRNTKLLDFKIRKSRIYVISLQPTQSVSQPARISGPVHYFFSPKKFKPPTFYSEKKKIEYIALFE